MDGQLHTGADTQQPSGLEIAVIGMAGRYPGAADLDQFWRNIESGVESVRPLTSEELAAGGIGEERLARPETVNSGAFLEDIELFDAGLFGYAARKAQLMDPQHRLFLETAWEALEHAGCAPEQFDGQIGVFAGTSSSSYLVDTLVNNPGALGQVALEDLMYENLHDLLASRVSYALNLTGPAVVVSTACSTSLVALHYACQSLLAGDCDAALAGGVRVSVPHKSVYTYAEGGILSRDGRCRSFDAGASGTISSNGVGVVVLKRLDDALRDGDTVHAIIKGSAVNNDGAQKVGYTAPSVEGQAEVVKKALVAAGVEADSIGYLEAHGTATHLGDPIEVAGLRKAYRHFTGRRNFCALGSVKANIGHADTAAGVAGVIKAVHMLREAVLPPSVNFETPNPELGLDDSPFYISRERRPWLEAVRRAGVSAFGIGGTNAHAILESAPVPGPAAPARPLQLLCFSGQTEAALQANIARFRGWLESAPGEAFADAAYTLQRGRRALPWRAAVVCADRNDAVARLAQPLAATHSRLAERPVAFMFSGQGSQYPGMMHGLYEAEAVFRHSVDASAAILRPLLGCDIRELIFATADAASRETLQRTRYAQPALFVTEYALAQLLMSWGVRPRACIGHSIGEYVAACLAGVFTLEGALALVAARAAAMDEMAPGAMLAVSLDEAEVARYLDSATTVAAVNAPGMVVVAGPLDAIDALAATLDADAVETRRLHTSHAFHSAAMEPCLERFARAFEGVALAAPTIPFISNVTGTWITDEQALSPAYWVGQLRAAVRFSDGVACVLADASTVLLEVGPGSALASLAEQQLDAAQRGQVLSCVRGAKRQADAAAVLYAALGSLWRLGVRIDWAGYHAGARRRKLPLPTYAFQRQRYWLDGASAGKPAGVVGDRLPPERWFYQDVWRQAALPVQAQLQAQAQAANWLLFEDERGVAGKLARLLRKSGQRVWTVRAGRGFRVLGNGRVQVRAGRTGDVAMLFDWLAMQQAVPDKVVVLSGVGAPARPGAVVDYAGFELLLELGRVWSQQAGGRGGDLFLVSSNLYAIGGGVVDPARSLAAGACRVMAKEFEQIRCKSIDIALPRRRLGVAPRLDLTPLLAELRAGAGAAGQAAEQAAEQAEVALRGRTRWIKAVEPVAVAVTAPVPVFRQGGVYLITGGFGGIGATLARHLASGYQARLILTGRGGVPPEHEWDAWLAGHDRSNDKSQRILLLRELAASGAQVCVIGADIADAAAMKPALAKAERQLGRVTGVIHSAGIADGALIARRSAGDSAAVFAAKVAGTQVLARLLRRHALDCFILCSSLASHIAPVGQVAYCAANAFEDAFAQAGAARGGPTRYLAIGWDSWREVGMAVDSLGAARLDYICHGITSAEGVAALERALASGLAHCYTSTRGLPLPETAPAAEARAEEAPEVPTASLHPRPVLAAPYVAPRDAVEECIAAIWEDKIGCGPLGVHDDFFELNGHSLMAVQIIGDIKRRLQVSLPTGLIYDNPTIAQLAGQVAARAGHHAGESQASPVAREAA